MMSDVPGGEAMRTIRRLIPFLIAVTATASAAMARDATGPWDGTSGPYQVRTVAAVTVHDANRDKDVLASIQIPEGRGPFPLIVFSHGYGGSKDGYQLLTKFWAGHGYVVIQPSHADAGALQTLRDLLEVKDIWKHQRPPQWKSRIADLVLMIDSLDAIERRVPELRGKIDRSRIGVAGHSYGALTTELVAGTTSYAEEPPLEFHDPRVTAAIAMSPEGTSEDLGFTRDSWKGIEIPVMYMTGSLDKAAGGHAPEWRREAYEYSRPGGKYLVFIEGARHLSFSGRALESGVPRGRQRGVRRPGSRGGGALMQGIDLEQERAIFSWIESASLAFWDATLTRSAAAKIFLASDALPRRSGGKVELDRK